MRALLFLTFITIFSVSLSFGEPLDPSASANARCLGLFRWIRAGTADSRGPEDPNATNSTVVSLLHSIVGALDRYQSGVSDLASSEGRAHLPVFRTTRDGLLVNFTMGGDRESSRVPSPQSFRELDARLREFQRTLITKGKSDSTVFYLKDPHQIRELLETGRLARKPITEKPEKEIQFDKFICTLTVGSIGAATNIISYLMRDTPATAEKRRIVERVRSQTPGNLTNHLRLARAALPLSLDDQEKDGILQRHEQFLNEMVRLGLVEPTYGATPIRYTSEIRYGVDHHVTTQNALFSLATTDPKQINLDTLQQAQRTNHQYIFLDQDIVQAENADKILGWGVSRRIFETVAVGGVATAAGYLACSKVNQILTGPTSPNGNRPSTNPALTNSEPLGPPPTEVRELREAFRAATQRDSSTEVSGHSQQIVHVGASTAQGHHSDVFLIISRGAPENTYALFGMNTTAPLSSVRTAPTQSSEALLQERARIRRETLNTVRERIRNTWFTTEPGTSPRVTELNLLFEKAAEVIKESDLQPFLDAIPLNRPENFDSLWEFLNRLGRSQ